MTLPMRVRHHTAMPSGLVASARDHVIELSGAIGQSVGW